MKRALVALLLFTTVAPDAPAKDLETEVVQTVLQFLDLDEQRLEDKGRRSVALGPWAGGAVVGNTTRGILGGSAQFGVGLYVFSDPMIDVDEIRKRVTFLAIRRLTEELFRNGDKASREKTIADLAREVKEELALRIKAEPRAWPKPKLVVNGEVDLKLGNAQANQIRAGAAIGVDKLSLGLTAGAEFGGGVTSFLVGPEVGTYLFLDSGPRPWLLALFARYDFRLGSVNRDRTLSVGARLVFDLI